MPAVFDVLTELARNLSWTWRPETVRLFESIDPGLWRRCEHNPILMLQRVKKPRLAALAVDRAFLAAVRQASCGLRSYLRPRSWFDHRYGRNVHGRIAYFSMEFGLHESLAIFAGGLGVLAGDHCKSASDLGVPLVGVGMFWRQGYTRQVIDARGGQTDRYDRLDPAGMPLAPVVDRAGRPLCVRVPIDSDMVAARAWRLDVGRVPIYLLDADVPQNPPRHRRLTDRLYSGDRDTRIRQEILLGIGGWKLLRALGLPAEVCHLNEGHAAFVSLERIAEVVQGGGVFREAARSIAATTVFTTHTPVEAGNETFEPKLVEKYLHRYCEQLGIDFAELMALGRVDPADASEPFGMTPLALRLSKRRNGVSKLHGRVSQKMWRRLWPRRSVERVPIGSITNGIHLRTWLHPKMAELFDEYLPAGWEDRQDERAVWAASKRIPDERLWGLHQDLKRELIAFVRARLGGQEGAGESFAFAGKDSRGRGCETLDCLGLRRGRQGRAGFSHQQGQGFSHQRVMGLNPDALTIGFARRFAEYKRATLLFSDLRRAARLLNDAARPVQVIFAGKAHPADMGGKALVAKIVEFARSPRFTGRVVFLEDYDMEVARHMVAGVDVWLNNPRRPQEASGTSGMKPTLHGGLNLSILDGWWPEACMDGVNGWAIGAGQDHDGRPASDKRDARLLYERLERDVVPLYYHRDRGGLPRAWIRCMKASLATIPAVFNSHRMVKEYLRRYYLPAMRHASANP